MLLQDIFSQFRLNLKKFLANESFLGGNTSPDNTQPLSKSPEDKEDKETKQIAEAIKTAFARIQCRLREQGYGELLNYLAGPTNLDRANIPSSSYFLLINGMANAIAANINEIEFSKRLNFNQPLSIETFYKIAINWLGIQAALDPNVVGDEITNFLRKERKYSIENWWSQILKCLSEIPQNIEGVTISIEQLGDNPENQQLSLTFNQSTEDNKNATLIIALLPPNYQKPKKLFPSFGQLWVKLKKLKASFSIPKDER